MRKTAIRLLGVTLALGLLVSSSGAASAVTKDTLRIQAARWWQWAVSIPLDGTHPLEGSGNDCMKGQAPIGPIYLGGVFNSSGTEERDCTIPAGRPVFAPVVNVECSTVEPDPFHGDTGAELRACAEAFTYSNQHAELDGEPLAVHTVTSPVFPFVVGPTWGAFFGGVEPGTLARSVANGGHIWIRGLAPGEYDLTMQGTIDDFAFTITVMYHLTVV